MSAERRRTLMRTPVAVWLLVAVLLAPALPASAQTAPSPPGPAVPGATVPATGTAGAALHAETEAPQFDIMSMLFVFMLATFIGLQVISRVSRLLHTPLMSLTNAISAIAVVGAIIVTGSQHPPYITLLGAIALFASTTNIVSGFLITDRMLKMFKTREAGK
jgi:H+-translocating NAD(P) transhydrogenase subunit alpha